MHGVLRLETARLLEAVPHAAELGEDVAGIRLVDVLREEGAAERAQLLALGLRLEDDRRPQGLEDVGVRLQGEDEELLQLPVDLISPLAARLPLLGRLREGPGRGRRWQVDA